MLPLMRSIQRRGMYGASKFEVTLDWPAVGPAALGPPAEMGVHEVAP